MNKNVHYENSIPEDYVLVKKVDAKSDKKLIAAYTFLSFVPLIIIAPVLFIIARYCNGYCVIDRFYDDFVIVALFVTCIILLVYVILHELVHGITYKIFTGSKLTFGITLTVVFAVCPKYMSAKKRLLPHSLCRSLFFRLYLLH